jgi:hypothetical protein
VTVPISMVAIWIFFYLTQLMKRPLIVTNDPDSQDLLEPEHAH